jgi:hypothetical protein
VGSVGQCSGEPEIRSALLSGNLVTTQRRACGFVTMRLLSLRCVRLSGRYRLDAQAQRLKHIHPVASGLSSLGAGPGRYAGRPSSGTTPDSFIWAAANQQIDSTPVHIKRYARTDYYLKLLIPS